MTGERYWAVAAPVPDLPTLVRQLAVTVTELDRDTLLDEAETMLRETLRLGAIEEPTVEEIAEIGGTHMVRSMLLAEITRRLAADEFDAPVSRPVEEG